MNSEQRLLRPSAYLEHMLEAVRLARTYSNGLTKVEFIADKKTQQAVILNLLVIGEAATQIARDHPDFAAQHPEFPWKEMRGMRNRMAHGYFEINLDTSPLATLPAASFSVTSYSADQEPTSLQLMSVATTAARAVRSITA